MEKLADQIYDIAKWTDEQGWKLSHQVYQPESKKVCLLSAFYLRRNEKVLSQNLTDDERLDLHSFLIDKSCPEWPEINGELGAISILWVVRCLSRSVPLKYSNQIDHHINAARQVATTLQHQNKLSFVGDLINMF